MKQQPPQEEAPRQKRRKRYCQEPEKSPELIVQDRDKAIAAAVHKYRYITTEGLLKLFAPQGRGERAMRRRLTLLFHRGYLARRFIYPLDRPGGVRFGKIVYVLDTEGGELLWGKETAKQDVKWKGGEEGKRLRSRKEGGHLHVEHSLAIAEFQLALDLALQEQEGVVIESFISDMEDVEMKVTVQIPSYSVKKSAIQRNSGTERVALWPDASFSIIGGKKRYFYFLEVDRADRKKERIFKRFLAYWQYVVEEREMLRKKRGVTGAFVVFVAPNEARRLELIKVANSVPEIPRRRPGFWFLNQEDISLLDPGRLLRESVALGLDGKPGFLTKF